MTTTVTVELTTRERDLLIAAARFALDPQLELDLEGLPYLVNEPARGYGEELPLRDALEKLERAR